jgi:hypothetical protein
VRNTDTRIYRTFRNIVQPIPPISPLNRGYTVYEEFLKHRVKSRRKLEARDRVRISYWLGVIEYVYLFFCKEKHMCLFLFIHTFEPISTTFDVMAEDLSGGSFRYFNTPENFGNSSKTVLRLLVESHSS